MKIAILAATATLLATAALAQSPAVQGRSGSTAGGYLVDPPNPSTGGATLDEPSATGSIGTGVGNGTRGGAVGGTEVESDIVIVPDRRGVGPTGDGTFVPRR